MTINWKYAYKSNRLFQQRAYNAAAVVHHMRKLHLPQSEPCSPDMAVHSHPTSERDLRPLGHASHEALDLDPNGNPLHAADFLDPDSGRDHDKDGTQSSSDGALFRPAKRWENSSGFNMSKVWKSSYVALVPTWQGSVGAAERDLTVRSKTKGMCKRDNLKM